MDNGQWIMDKGQLVSYLQTRTRRSSLNRNMDTDRGRTRDRDSYWMFTNSRHIREDQVPGQEMGQRHGQTGDRDRHRTRDQRTGTTSGCLLFAHPS